MNRALRAATMGVLLLSPVVLSACSAGQTTQTASQERDKTGAQAQVGDLSIRQGQLLSPRGGSYDQGDDAELQMTIVNEGTDDDALVSISGDGFASAQIESSAASTSSSSSASATPGATSTSSSSSSSSSTAPQEIPIPAGGAVSTGAHGSYTVTLTDLDKGLTTGQYLAVTLTFDKAGEVTIPVTVANPASYPPRSETYDYHQEAGTTEG